MLKRKEKKLAEFWRAVDPYYVVAEKLATSLSLAMWKMKMYLIEQSCNSGDGSPEC